MKKLSFHPIQHFLTVTEHRLLVMKLCFKVGLYRQGLLHDLSKYSFAEFWVGAMYYQGNRSPNNAEREERGYSSAWLHHKGRNKHHYEYWVDYNSRAESAEEILIPVKMPIKYVVEMLMDRISASKVYNRGNYSDDLPLKYFAFSMERITMHEDTKRLLYKLLKMLSVRGEERTFKFIREKLLKRTAA